ncbi:ribulose-phosphate 3-epimerase [Treponema endosymbiont of Eucomonympha sp.]|uniref:ribulose-phosphate 3-epimerase n=1 Tax=Treponema endosymbiont of Eucomonympha sp. TaxID=1580831 RepID=UPI001E4F3A4B|nr:ribulose-phosphate 3-epimerase [Treponema endosymbiont of Eucomonympha sp.]
MIHIMNASGVPRLAPSLLAADFSHLADAVCAIESRSGAFVHIDVMDGVFVPEISFGEPVLRSLRPLTKLPFDVHLMVAQPETHVESFAAAGADYITFHAEAAIHQHRTVHLIHQMGKKAGIAIVPSTPVSQLAEILPFVDIVLVMTVNPGFSSQKMIMRCTEKIRDLAALRAQNHYVYLISADGGINAKTIASVTDAGVDIAVSGSAFFSGELNGNASVLS